jgi:hypothetical protein
VEREASKTEAEGTQRWYKSETMIGRGQRTPIYGGGGGGVMVRGSRGAGRGSYVGNGAGLGNFLSSLWRGLIPLFRRGVKVAAKTAVKAAKSKTGKSLIKSAKKSAKKAAFKGAARLLQGEDVIEGAKSDLGAAKRDIGKTLDMAADSANKEEGSGKRQKNKKTLAIGVGKVGNRKKLGGGKSLI